MRALATPSLSAHNKPSERPRKHSNAREQTVEKASQKER